MTRLPADAAVRARALDPTRSFIVQAPAGSGKTSLLVRRFLRLLARVEQPESIVAMTFTRKAAGEMRSRIIEAIALAAGDRPVDPHQAALWEIARPVLQRDRVRGWRLAANPRRLRVQTIDSLTAALVRQMPWAARCGAPPGIDHDAAALYREAVRKVLRHIESPGACQTALARMLMHRDGDQARLAALIESMLACRDQWLRHVGGTVADQQWRAAVESGWRQRVAGELQVLHKTLPVGIGPELLACARHAGANRQRENADDPLARLAGLQMLPGVAPGALDDWRAIRQLLLTKEGNYRIRPNRTLGFPDGAKDPTGMQPRMQVLLASLAGNDELRIALDGVGRLPAPTLADGRWQVLKALIEVLRMTVAELYLTFQRLGRYDFAEQHQRASAALGEPEAPTDLALRLDYGIHHLLVDEFQDTSFGQLDLLTRLTAGWQAGDGRTLFLVGDPMQSIYRFREAEVGIFLAVRDQGLAGLPLDALQLTANFRSGAALVEWVNATFTQVLPVRADTARGAVPFARAEAFAASQPADQVICHALVDADSRSEATQVLNIIIDAQQRDPGADIAVLVRSRSHAAPMLRLLVEHDIDVAAIEMQTLDTRQAILDLLALTRAIGQPADRLAWLTVLRAPWCGLTLADLTRLAGDRHSRAATVFPAAVELAALSDAGQARLARVWPILQDALAQHGRQPLRRTVESAWLRLGGPACVAAAELGNTRQFFDLLEEFDAGGVMVDIPGLVDALHRRHASRSGIGDHPVQVMTIHKAKGLEFDVVILPGLDKRPRSDAKRLLEWAAVAGTDGAESLLLAPLGETGADEDPMHAYLRRFNAERARLETGRLLYVAATRARRRLHLVASLRSDAGEGYQSPLAGSLLAALWPAVEQSFLAAADTARPGVAAVRDRSAVGMPTLMRLPDNWQAPPLPVDLGAAEPVAGEVAAVEYSWAGDRVRRIGIVLHLILSRVTAAELAGGVWIDPGRTAVIDVLLREARLASAGLEAARTQVIAALHGMQHDSRAAWIFADRASTRAEWALTRAVNGELRRYVLDRSFVDAAGVRWIIDFKTGAHRGGDIEAFLDREQARYRDQLARYAATVGTIENRPIRLGLYFPLTCGWREWAADETAIR